MLSDFVIINETAQQFLMQRWLRRQYRGWWKWIRVWMSWICRLSLENFSNLILRAAFATVESKLFVISFVNSQFESKCYCRSMYESKALKCKFQQSSECSEWMNSQYLHLYLTVMVWSEKLFFIFIFIRFKRHNSCVILLKSYYESRSSWRCVTRNQKEGSSRHVHKALCVQVRTKKTRQHIGFGQRRRMNVKSFRRSLNIFFSELHSLQQLLLKEFWHRLMLL